MNKTSSEKREYFRIMDHALVTVEKVPSDQELEPLLIKHSSFIIRSAINALELEHQAVASKIKRTDPDISDYFKLINKKIDLIATYLQQTSTEFTASTPTEINLSASGIAIQTDKVFSVKDHVSIQLLLLPENNGIMCIGQIMHIKKLDITYSLSIDFSNIKESDRELIIKHTMTKQLEQARDKNTDYN